jgi:hypothetical protein
MSSKVIDIPDAPSVTGFEHIRSTGDLSSVVLHRNSFTAFEKEIIRCFPNWFSQKPLEWDGVDLTQWSHIHKEPIPPTEEDMKDLNYQQAYRDVTEDAVTFIIRTFSEKLPTFKDSKGVALPDSNLTVIDPYPTVSTAPFTDMGGISTVMRFGDVEIVSPEYVEKFGNRTSVHFMPPWFLMANPDTRYASITIISAENEWYTLFAYAQYLHRGGDPKTAFVLKPSFRKGIDELARQQTSMKHIMLGVGLRVFGKVTWYGAAENDVVAETAKHLNRLSPVFNGEG